MNRLLCCLSAFAKLLALITPLFAANINSKELVLVANFWEPFTGENLPRKGFASHLVSEILQSKGYKVDIIIMPWARILFTLQNKSGQVDGVVSIWRTSEREEYTLLSNAYYVNELCLVKHIDTSFTFNGLSDLDGKIIGVGRNYDYSDEIQNATNFTRAEAVTLGQNLMRLAKKRVDLVLTDCVIGQHYLRNLRIEGQINREIEFVDGVVDSTPLYFGVPKSQPNAEKIVEDFNQGLLEFQQSGALKEIYSLWQVSMPPDADLAQ